MSLLSIHGISRTNPPRNATSRGNVLKAESCSDVATWIRFMTMPTQNPIASSGALSQKAAIRLRESCG